MFHIAQSESSSIEPVLEQDRDGEQKDHVERYRAQGHMVRHIVPCSRGDMLLLTNHAEYGGEDCIEVAVRKVAKGTHASWLLRRDEGVRTGAILAEGRSCRVDVTTAVELGPD